MPFPFPELPNSRRNVHENNVSKIWLRHLIDIHVAAHGEAGVGHRDWHRTRCWWYILRMIRLVHRLLILLHHLGDGHGLVERQEGLVVVELLRQLHLAEPLETPDEEVLLVDLGPDHDQQQTREDGDRAEDGAEILRWRQK